MSDKDFLRLEAVDKRFGAVEVLRRIDLSVAGNEFLTILGPSGSGKTTVLRIIGGFEQPSGGRVHLGGEDITDRPINRRPCNTVFQDYALFPHLSVRRNVGYGLMVRRTPARIVETKVDEVLAIVGLESLASRLPHELSGGQRQRVALARAIVCEPRVILLDEPLAALDVALRAQMCAFLKGLQKRLHIAFVFITHDQQEAIAMSDRIAVMKDGRIEQTGTPRQLYLAPTTRFVANFFGENNLFGGTLLDRSDPYCNVETAMGPVAGRYLGASGPPGGRVDVAIRPEHIRLAAVRPGARRFIVRNVQFAGPSTLIDVVDEASGSISLRLRLSGGSAEALPDVGTAVGLEWPLDSVTVMNAGGDHDG